MNKRDFGDSWDGLCLGYREVRGEEGHIVWRT
jgi:hypothetical protein